MKINKSKIFSWFKFLIGWPLSFIAFFYITKFVVTRSNEIIPHLQNINLGLLGLSIICFIICFVLRAFTWQKMMEDKGYKIPILETIYRWEFSEIKRYVPGSIWSFISRASLFKDVGVETKISAHAILIEIELVALSCLILSLFSIPLILNSLNLGNLILPTIFIFTVISLIGIFLFLKGNSIFKGKVSNIFPNYKLQTNITILVIYLIAFTFFGLGTYFSISSVIPIELNQAFGLISFFIFSLLVGYLSLITPSGIGVREGIMVYVLSKPFGIALAGFAAIFSRLILIFSELIFALTILLFARANKENGIKFVNFIQKYSYEFILGLFFIIYNIYFITASIFRYNNYYTGRFDLGNMSQTVWNTFHGNIFVLTNPNGTEEITRLAFHADFILILLSPFYFLWEDPRTLLIIQTLVLSFGGIFIYLLTKNVLKNKTIALVLAFCFFISPAVNYTNLYDFHAVTLATTFLLGSFYFIQKKKYWAVIVFLILAGISKEQIWAINALVGIYLLIFHKQRILGSIIAIFSAIIFYVLFWIAIPQALGSQHFALEFYADYGDSPSSIIKNILIHPLKTIQTLLLPDRIGYMQQLFMPLGYLSILGFPFLIFSSPDLAISLLSNNPQLHQIYYQYSASITPFIFLSVIYGLSFLTKKLPFITFNMISVILIIMTLASAFNFGPLPYAKKPNLDMFYKPLGNRDGIDKYISQINIDEKITASNNLGSHLSHRKNIYVAPYGIEIADQVLFFITPSSNEFELQAFENIKNNPKFSLTIQDQNFYAFKRISP